MNVCMYVIRIMYGHIVRLRMNSFAESNGKDAWAYYYGT